MAKKKTTRTKTPTKKHYLVYMHDFKKGRDQTLGRFDTLAPAQKLAKAMSILHETKTYVDLIYSRTRSEPISTYSSGSHLRT